MGSKLTWGAVLAGVSLVLSGCSGQDTTAGSGDGPIRIGVVLPLTGEVAIDGQLEANGIELAVAEINASGGVNGRNIEVTIEDGGCDPAASAAAAQKLITRDEVVALEGAGGCSSATAAIMPLVARARIPLVAPSSTATDLTNRGNAWFSRTAATEDQMSRAAIPLIVEKEQLQSAYIIAVNDDYGNSYLNANKANLQKAGVQLAGTGTFNANTQDFAPLITQMEQTGTQSVFVAADTSPGANLFKQLAQFGARDLVRVSAQVAASPQFIELATAAVANGIYVTAPYIPQGNSPRNSAFVESYQAKYGKAPESYAAGGYDAMYLFADALKRSNGEGGEALQQAIRATDMETVRGQLTFDDKGQGLADFVLAQIRDGKVQLVQQLSTRG